MLLACAKYEIQAEIEYADSTFEGSSPVCTRLLIWVRVSVNKKVKNKQIHSLAKSVDMNKPGAKNTKYVT